MPRTKQELPRSLPFIAVIAAMILMLLTSCEYAPTPTGPPFPPEPFEDELYSRAAIVIDAECGTVIFARNADEQLKPASTLKTMTFLLALELVELRRIDIDEVGLIEVPHLIWAAFGTDNPNTVGGSMSGIVPNQTSLTYRDLFHALMLRSGNEAANIIAHNLGGRGENGISAFVALMNERAAELGLSGSRFANAHGLNEEGNFATVRDLAAISLHGYQNHPLFREIAGTFEYIMPANSAYRNGYRIQNTNALIRNSVDEDGNSTNRYFRGFALGVKTGSLNNVWHFDETRGEWVNPPGSGIANLVSSGELGGREYIVVTLEAPWRRRADGIASSHYALSDHLALYDWLMTIYN